MIDFEPDLADAELAARAATFVRDQIIPFESDTRWTAHGPTDELRTELTGLARRAGLLRYPFLARLPELGISTLDLQFHEAEILRLAMEELMAEHGVGFLPMHDALIVPRSHAELAREAIRGGFRRYFQEVLGMPAAPLPIIPEG